MKAGEYKSRRHQMLAFAREVKAGKMSLNEALRAASMCGACEERSRTLRICKRFAVHHVLAEIVKVSVLEVLGYE